MASDNWISTTIGELIKREGGSIKTGPFGTVLKANEYSTNGVPLISVTEIGYGSLRIRESTPRVPKEVIERLPEYILEAGDIVFGRKGAIDRLALIRSEQAGWFLGSDGIRLRLPKSCDAQFIAYQLQDPQTRSWLRQHATGTTMASLNQEIIERVPIVLPPLEKQRAIARILGALDDKIELNRRMNETLEAMAQALFKSWFVDFDPVRAKAEGRDTGLPAEIADKFPDEFEDTRFGEIPRGWCIMRVADIADINSWSLGKSDEIDRIEYVEISEVVRGDIGTIKVYQRGEEPSRARRRLRHGDTVLSTVRPDRGSYFLCLNPSPNLIASTGFAVVTPTKAPWSYVHAALTQPEVFEYLGQQADGGAYPAVRPEVISRWQLPWPDKPDVIETFSRTCTPLYEKAEHNRRESRTLATIRDALLSRLLRGELSIKDAEKSVREAI